MAMLLKRLVASGGAGSCLMDHTRVGVTCRPGCLVSVTFASAAAAVLVFALEFLAPFALAGQLPPGRVDDIAGCANFLRDPHRHRAAAWRYAPCPTWSGRASGRPWLALGQKTKFSSTF